jgi:hypothetical protein
VFLADGRPAVGAEVWLHGYPPREAVAGTDGGFELVGAVLDAETFLNVAHPEAALFCLQPIPAAHEDLVLQLERPWAIRGRVVDGAGATVVGAVLRVVGARVIDPPADHGVVPTWEWANELDTVRSDTDGEFAFERLYAGPFELQAARDDLGVGRVTQVVAAPASEVVVRLTEAAVRRAVVRGTAVAAVSGEPLVGGTVTVLPEGGGMPRRVDVDAEGRFELAGFEPGRYGVTATAAGCADTGVEVELVLGETEVRLEVPPAIDVTLRLVDGSGRPIEAAKVALRRAGGQFVSFRVGQLGLYRLRTDAGGEIALRAVPAEVVDLVVERDGEIDVERRLDLRVEPGTRVQVVLAAAEERVEVTVMVAAAGEDVEVDLASREGLMAFRALLGDGRLARPTGVVRATLSVDGGRELAQATATPAGAADEAGPWGPDVPMWRYSVRVESPEGPSGSSASPMPLPSFVLPGRAVRMRLRVEVEGFAPVEVVVDGAALAGGGSGAPRPPQVVLLRRR